MRNKLREVSPWQRIKTCSELAYNPIEDHLGYSYNSETLSRYTDLVNGRMRSCFLKCATSIIWGPLIWLPYFLYLLVFYRQEDTRASEESNSTDTKIYILVDLNAWIYDGSDILWASLMKELWDPIELKCGKDEIRIHRIKIALSGELPTDSMEVKMQKREDAYRKYLRSQRITFILGLLSLCLGIVLLVFRLYKRYNNSNEDDLISDDDIDGIMSGPFITLLSLLAGGTFATALQPIYLFIRYIYPQLNKVQELLNKANQIDQKYQRRDFTADTGFMGEVKTEFELMLDFLGTKNARMQIFIDDLDRCSPSTVMDVMEAIILFLVNGPVTCWLAIDTRIVVASIEDRNRGVFDEAEINGYEYLEKIIQLPFCIPDLETDKKKTFMNRIFVQNQLNVNTLYRGMWSLQEKNYLPIGFTGTLDRLYYEDEEAILVERLRVFVKELIQHDSQILADMKESFPRDTNIESIVAKKIVNWDAFEITDREDFLLVVAECIQAIQVSFNEKETDLNRGVENKPTSISLGADNATDESEYVVEMDPPQSNPAGVELTNVPDGDEEQNLGSSSFAVEVPAVVPPGGDGPSNPNLKALPADFTTMVTPMEKKWFNMYSGYFVGKGRKIIRIINSYNVARHIASLFLGDNNTVGNIFYRKLLKFVTLSEQWPYRTALLLQVAEDFGQQIATNNTGDKEDSGNGMNGECISEILQKICGKDDPEDVFNLPLSRVYKKLVQSVMYSPRKVDKELPRDGDAELFEELLADADGDSELRLIDFALPDHHLKWSVAGATPSLRPFMFNMQRDMIERVARYMDEILLFYDEEGQYTMFERKKKFYLRRDRRNEQMKDASSNRKIFKGSDDDEDLSMEDDEISNGLS